MRNEAPESISPWKDEPSDGGGPWGEPPPELPMGTRDEPPRSINTRIEGPAARARPASGRVPPPTPRPPERTDDRIGQVLGSYRLLELIGKGGMGFVYRAEHARLGREVALKLLRTDYAKRRDAVSRFFQEARTVNRVRHRNIVDVTDFIELEDGTTFIIMELLRGKSLGAWSRGGFELPRALAALIQICDGLSAAHAVGVIHRDLKPDNIVIVATPDGAELVKLLDFGVAKLLNRDDEDVGLETAAGSVIGTPAYMSPEQAGGLAVDNRADIYSLGAIMYELFCGQPLFRGRSFGEYVRKHLNEHPVPPRETAGGANIDHRVEQVLLRCLCKDPNGRYPSAEALRDDLLHVLAAIETHEHDLASLGRDSGARSGVRSGDVPLHARSTVAPVGYATMMAQAGMPYLQSQPPLTPYPDGASWAGPAPRRTRWMWGIGAAAVLGIAVAGALVAAASKGTPIETPAAEATPAPPAVTAMDRGKPTLAPVVVTVKIEAPAGARVEAAGSTLALCTTPCVLTIDPADGGSTTRRDFVVRKDGLADAAFSVDLASPVPTIEVALAALPPPIEMEPDDDALAVVEPTPTPTPTPTVRANRTSRRRPEPKVVKAAKVTPPPPVEPAPKVVDDPPPVPPVRKPPKDRKVDPTATIDPFAAPK